jgi:hypothetical protein
MTPLAAKSSVIGMYFGIRRPRPTFTGKFGAATVKGRLQRDPLPPR